ncbi:MAG: AAA family ATPase, partial [Oscillospiraceae bacterium]|nr:AAA family ATPase [Oscillospiraceae bacterium]
MPLRIDEQIMNSDRVICRHIDSIENATIGEISQDILSHLRHFVEHIMLKIYAKGDDIEDSHENVQKAVKFVKSQNKLKHIARFHRFLQVSVSHRTLAEENANRLMLKYYEYLLRIKNYLRDNYSMEVLHNLEQFPIEIDDSYKEYYEKIAEKIDIYHTPVREGFRFDRFYIQSIKPFFVKSKVYYEVAFIPANDKASKTDRIIAFTDIELFDYYAVRFAIANNSIEIFEKTMPIRIIVDWEVNIRPCEYANFAKLIYKDAPKLSKTEQQHLSQYLTETGTNLAELLDISDDSFVSIRSQIVPNSKSVFFFDVLDYCRDLVKNHRPGANILKYLLYHMTNRILKSQYKKHWNKRNRKYTGNFRLSDLYLHYKCIPFDQMPFCSSLRKHVPSISDIFDCFDVTGREHEVLAWHIRHNTEQKGILFTPLERIDGSDSYNYKFFNDVEALVRIYNSKLYDNDTQQARKLIIKNGHIFIESYKDDTISIIKTIMGLTASGIYNYSNTVQHWIETQDHSKVSEEKKSALIKMFDKSKVALIYGAAGTGKTTLINYISTFFKEYSRLYLAHTNPAVNNLKRKVSASSKCEFMTITKFISPYAKEIKRAYDILIIDECSTVNNQDMRELLRLAEYKLLILVGDIYQIEAIEFGNWFNAVRFFIPQASVCELKKPFRTESQQLLDLWDNVRKMKGDSEDSDVLDRLQAGEFSAELDTSIFTPAAKNEIILCLNYGGLYGINNINHFMQENNNGKEIYRGIHRYKVGDPILFNDAADSFFSSDEDEVPVIHNNMKAKIVDFAFLNEGQANESIQFDVELDKPLIELNMQNRNFTIIGTNQEGNSIIRFEVFKNKSTDDDDDETSRATVPFQIAYAVSIHKAQGLEYDSVKIVITDEIDELITHSIFYTAITRAKKR